MSRGLSDFFRWENSLGQKHKCLKQAWPWETGSISPSPHPLQYLIYVKGQILLCHSDVNAKYHQAAHWSELRWEQSKQLKSATVFHPYNSGHIFCSWVEPQYPLDLKFLRRGRSFPPVMVFFNRHYDALVQARHNIVVVTSSPLVQFPQFHVCTFPKPKSLQNNKTPHAVLQLCVGMRLLNYPASHPYSHEAGQKKGTVGYPAKGMV